MFKILLIILGSIFVGAILISYLTFFFYIKRIFIDNAVSAGEERRVAGRIWRKSKFIILKMASRIMFRGER